MDKYLSSYRFFSKFGLKDKQIKVLLFCFEHEEIQYEKIRENLEIPEKEITEIMNFLHKKNLIIPKKEGKNIVIKHTIPYPIPISLIDFITESIRRLENHFPRVLEKQLHILDEKEYDHNRIEDFEEYLEKTKEEIPEIIENEYKRYHAILKKTNIFGDIQNRIQNLKEEFELIEKIIKEEMNLKDSFIQSATKKVERKFKEEFQLEELTESSTQLFMELFQAYFNRLTEKYIERLQKHIESLTSETLEDITQLSEIAQQASTDLEIAFMAIRTGMKAILNDLYSRIKRTHLEADTNILNLSKAFKSALNRSFKKGTLGEVLEFLEITKKSLKELESIHR